jgi:hypothetical protein
LVIAVAMGVSVPRLQGQGAFTSNIGQTSSGALVVGSDSWMGAAFFTGDATPGYRLQSIELLMGEASGSPSGFTVEVYDSMDRIPAASVGVLSNGNPLEAGTFTYNAPDITLSPDGLYFVVVTSTTPVTSGSYSWRSTDTVTHDAAGGWAHGTSFYTSSDGMSWTRGEGTHVLQFAITASVIPEPSTLGLLLTGGALFLRCASRRGKRGNTF